MPTRSQENAKDIDLHDSVAGEEDPGASLDMEPDGEAAPTSSPQRENDTARDRPARDPAQPVDKPSR